MKARETPLPIAYNEHNGDRGLARETKGKVMFTRYDFGPDRA